MSAALRVLHVVLSLGPGGTERLVIEMAKRMRPLVVPFLCCLDVAGEWADEVRREGIPVEVLGRSPGFHPGLGRRLAAVAAGQGATVLHCHQYSPFVYGAIARLLSPHLALVVTEHGRLSDAGPSPKRHVANRILGAVPQALVAISEEQRRFMVREGFSTPRLRVVHNGIDPGPEPTVEEERSAREMLSLPSEAFVIGTIARFDTVKDLRTLVEAVAQLPGRDGLRLVMIGDGPERAALEAHVARRGLSQVVGFTGVRRDARRLLPAFDVFVNSSVTEGISLTILEAMAAARPVVATAVGGTPEVVVDGCTGRLVASGDVAAMAAGLAELRASAGLGRRQGRAGRDRVLEAFTLPRMMDAYLDLYRHAVGGC